MNTPTRDQRAELLKQEFHATLGRLESATGFAKANSAEALLDISSHLMALPSGPEFLLDHAPRYTQAGIFADSDWDRPEVLRPQLTASTFAAAPPDTVTLELLSLLRFLSLSEGNMEARAVSSEEARGFLNEVLAANPGLTFRQQTEALRETRLRGAAEVFALLVQHLGYEAVLEAAVREAWMILRQRPIVVDRLRSMITSVSIELARGDIKAPPDAWRLISALYGPTEATRSDPGLEWYAGALESMDQQHLRAEAGAFARSMHDTGLVSFYHPVLLRFLNEHHPDLVPVALGLSSTGTDVLLTYRDLVSRLIAKAVTPDTPQCILGLMRLLERGILYAPPVAPGLWRQLNIALHPAVRQSISATFGTAVDAEARLLAGLINVLGQPLGVGQGDNPTCQSARAISMWAWNDPDFLMQLLTWACRDNEIVMHFEGTRISSLEAADRLGGTFSTQLDAVSLVLVPHLDRIYMRMGELTAGRGEDPHRWINPEFHGWWVGRGFSIAVNVASGKLKDYEQFIRDFHASYHPFYNRNQPVIHPQPAGIGATNSLGRFVGWHAITILRVTLDPAGDMRVYFYNPNNDSRQDWGHGVRVSVEGNGEYFGESSLPFAEFASRLYIFHHDLAERGDGSLVPSEDVSRITGLARESWAAER